MQEREAGLPSTTFRLSFCFSRSIFFLDSMSSVVRWASGVKERACTRLLMSGGIEIVDILNTLVSYDFLTFEGF